MRRDKDGIWHLDYFKNLHLAMHQNSELSRQISGLIDQNITAHESARRWSEYAKWFWFREEMAAVRRENPEPHGETNLLSMPSGHEG